MKSGAMRLAIVHFPGGALALERGGEPFAIPSVHVPAEQIIGANGAGDAFAAGAVYGLLLGWPTADSIRLAHAAAAASLRSMTTTGTVEPWRDCLKLADSWGWRASL